MNKAELVEAIQGEFESKAKAERAVNSILEALKRGLKRKPKSKDDKVRVQLVGFGTFTVKERKEREGRDPRTRKPITIPKSKTVSFKAGKELKDML